MKVKEAINLLKLPHFLLCDPLLRLEWNLGAKRLSLWMGFIESPNELWEVDNCCCRALVWPGTCFRGVMPGPKSPENSFEPCWSTGNPLLLSFTGVNVVDPIDGATLKPFMSRLSFWRFFLPPAPPGPPDAVLVFMPLFLRISTSSQRKAEMSCLISLTSSSVTPWDSARLCWTVT